MKVSRMNLTEMLRKVRSSEYGFVSGIIVFVIIGSLVGVAVLWGREKGTLQIEHVILWAGYGASIGSIIFMMFFFFWGHKGNLREKVPLIITVMFFLCALLFNYKQTIVSPLETLDDLLFNFKSQNHIQRLEISDRYGEGKFVITNKVTIEKFLDNLNDATSVQLNHPILTNTVFVQIYTSKHRPYFKVLFSRLKGSPDRQIGTFVEGGDGSYIHHGSFSSKALRKWFDENYIFKATQKTDSKR